MLDEIPVPDDVEQLARACGQYGDTWRHQCHRASIAIVQSGLYPGARVARGAALGVLGQHSWVALGDPYDENSTILDATLWSYDPKVTGVVSDYAGRRWRPHGSGIIWNSGRPATAAETGEEPIELTPTAELSRDARNFLTLVGPLGRRGWMTLANSPVGGWPAAEIIAAMDDTEALTALVPIDILGMLTDRNPGGLYLPSVA